MSASSAYASHQYFQDFLGDFYSRRLLLHNPLYPPPAAYSTSSHDKSSSSSSYSRAGHYLGGISLDASVVMVLSVLLCALICSLGLNSIIRCALRCSSFVAWWESFSSSSSNNSSARSANTGVKKKALKTFPIVNYSAELNLPGLDSECVICLSDLSPGERVRLLPTCNHGFHVKCIDKWLSSHSSCPKCRQSLIETRKKIVAASSSSSATVNSHHPPPAVGEHETIVVSIATLEHEGYIRSYRGTMN